MSFRPFTSESYSEDDRPEAWRDVLRAVGLQQFAAAAASGGYATASRRHAEGQGLTIDYRTATVEELQAAGARSEERRVGKECS